MNVQIIFSRLIRATAALLLALSALLPTIVPHAHALTQAPFTESVIEPLQGSWGKNLGDLNGDGQLDIIEGGGDLGTNVYWYSYPSWTKYQIGTVGGDDDLQVGDINGDGAPDVIVNGGMYWYENPRGSGGDVTTAWKLHTIDASTNTHDLVVGDINGDGKLDVLGRGTGETGPTTMYLQGATPDTWTKVNMTTAPDGQGIALADINRDGRTDIVMNGFWLEQTGDPTVATNWIYHSFATWSAGCSLDVADINHDGRVDIFLAPSEAGTGTLSWFENPSDPVNGTWTRHDILTNVTDIHRFHIVDMNKDGNADVVFAEMHQSPLKRVGVLYNGGSGASWNLQVLSSQGSHNIAVGDIGRDGDEDIVGANWSTTQSSDGGALKLWRNDMTAGLSMDNWTYKAIDTAKTDRTFGLAFGDMNGDGLSDVISGQYWYLNPGGDLMGNWVRTDMGTGVNGMLVTDVDGDGQPDIIAETIINNIQYVQWLKPNNPAATSFTTYNVGTMPNNSRDYISQGYDVTTIDGKKAIMLSNDAGYYYFTIPSNPTAGNWPQVQINTDGTQEGLAAGDINGDGRMDVAGSSHTSPTANGTEVDWWTNPGTGAGNWTKQVVGTTSNEVSRVRVADVNNDGRLDIIAVDDDLTVNTGNVYWFEQTTTGWVKHVVATGLGSLESMDVGDFNQDGNIDIVTGDHRGDNLKTIIWQNGGGGAGWVSHIIATGVESHMGTRVADLNNDGALDIVSIAYDTYQTMSLWRNDAMGIGAVTDTTPPTISNVGAAVSSTNANVTWSTNETSDSQVEYGLTASYGTTTPLDSSQVTNHSVSLAGLSPSTTYHYHVISKDAAGNSSTSADATFTTTATGVISHMQSTAVTQDSSSTNIQQQFNSSVVGGDLLTASASWSGNTTMTCSDNQGDSFTTVTTQYDSSNDQSLGICYAPNAKSGATTITATFGTSASYRRLAIGEYTGIASVSPADVSVMNSAAGTTATNGVTSTAKTTTTNGELIYGAVMDDAGTTSITAGTGFTQRASVNNKDLAVQDMVQSTAGSVASTQTFATAHHYLAHMVAFKPAAAPAAPDTTPPVISNVASSNVTSSGATVTWTTDEASDSQIEYGTTTSYGSATPLDSTLVTSHSGQLSGLAASTTYHYHVKSKDAAGNLATSADATFTTPAAPAPDTTPPVISNVASSNVTSSGATVTWTTDEASDSQVSYGTTTSYGNTTTLNTSLVTSHSVNLTGLSSNTTYHYQVVSKDAASNSSTSADATFTTPAAPKISYVQSAASSTDTSASTITQAFKSANTAGNAIVVAVSWGNNATITCSDSLGNTYAVATTQYDSTNQQSLGICYALNTKAGAANTVTVTFSKTVMYRRIAIHEYSGIATTSAVDVSATNLTSGTTATDGVTSTAQTTTVNGDLIFGAVMDDTGTTSITAGKNFTQRAYANNKDLATQDMVQATAGSVASTQTFAKADRYLAQMVAFKAAP